MFKYDALYLKNELFKVHSWFEKILGWSTCSSVSSVTVNVTTNFSFTLANTYGIEAFNIINKL